LGAFKTALQKGVRIQDFEIRLFRYPDGSSRNSSEGGLNAAKAVISREEDLTNLINWVAKPDDNWSLNLDLSNVSEISINGFDYQLLDDKNLMLGVQSKRAILNSEYPEVLLRGHVRVTAPGGKTLESNVITWNMKKRQFIADRGYLLNHNGMPTVGKGICVDSQLNTIWAKGSKFQREREKKWSREHSY
jgi:hypothetical protein